MKTRMYSVIISIVVIALVILGILFMGLSRNEKCREAAKADYSMLDPECTTVLAPFNDCECWDKDRHCKELSCDKPIIGTSFDLKK